MKHRRSHLKPLILADLKEKKRQTAELLIISGVLSFVLFGGSVFAGGVQNGMKSLKSRLGADIMVVSADARVSSQGVLIKGDSDYSYMDRSVLDKVRDTEGVDQATSQFFLASSGQPCCDLPVEFVGYDPATDFVVSPWIARASGGRILPEDTVVVGHDVPSKGGDTLTFYGRQYRIGAVLDETGTDLDSVVFSGTDTIKDIYQGAVDKGFAFTKSVNPDKNISSVLIKVSKGCSTDQVISNLHRADLGNVQILSRGGIMDSTADSISRITEVLYPAIGAVFILVLFILTMVYHYSVLERRREFALMRAAGASRRQVSRLVLSEALILGALGAAAGIILASVVVFPFNAAIEDSLHMPYLLPSVGKILLLMLAGFVLTLAAGLAGAALSSGKAARAEQYLNMREL